MQYKKRARSKAAKSDRKDAIIAAAEALLRQLGYDAMTMQAVAMEAGLGKGTLYLYFSSREGLILEVYGRLFDTWIGHTAAQVAVHVGNDIALAWLGILLKQRSCLHDLSRLAVTALGHLFCLPC